MQSGKELWEFTLFLTKTDKKGFEGGLEVLHKNVQAFLNKRKADINGYEQVCALKA